MTTRIRSHIRFGSLLALLLKLVSGAADAAEPPVAELHVSPTGSDDASGSAAEPLQSPQRALRVLNGAGRIVLHAGTYAVTRRLDIEAKGVTIAAASGETVTLEPAADMRSLFNVTAEGVTIDGVTIDAKFREGTGAIRGHRSAAGLTIRNCECRNFTRHAVDVDGPDTLIENCHIHHCLWFHDGKRDDAHGIVTEHAHRLRIRGCRVHNTSGDCWQGGRGDWQDVVIEECDFYDAPLETAMAGYPAGGYTAENAIDTKLDTKVERGRLTLKRCHFHGFRSTLIENSSALNLKENVDVVVDGCVVDDSVVGVRLRGTTRGGVWPTVVNCTIRDCDTGVRHEDNLENLRFTHNTLFNCTRFFVRAPTRSRLGHGWVVANNLLLDISRFPDEVRGTVNQGVSSKLFDAKTLQPLKVDRLQGRPAANALPPWYGATVDFDQVGKRRSAERPVMGAFEESVEEKK